MFRISRVIFANCRKLKCINSQVTFTPTCNQRSKNTNFSQVAIAASLFSFFKKKDENEESELIMTIKRGILCIQREEHQKAEKMFHLALRLAQTVQDNAAITYIYDCMANLAYELGDLEKAEKIFVSVCQRLMQYDGAKEDDIRMLHISTKIAHMAYLRNNFDKSLQGLEYALAKIESQNYMENDELLELWGLVKNFLGQTLIQMGRHEEAIKALTEAFAIFKKFREEASEDGMILLNNLSCACSELKQYEQAEMYLKQAIEIAKAIKIEDISTYKINLGLLYFKQGLLDKTKDMCKTAWHIAKKHDNKEALNGADDCLEQLKKVLL